MVQSIDLFTLPQKGWMVKPIIHDCSRLPMKNPKLLPEKIYRTQKKGEVDGKTVFNPCKTMVLGVRV
jgi:hypothetical protein